MKLLHTSDLHLGKTIAAIPMLEEQKSMLFGQIIPIIEKERPDAILISGDVFDRSNPSAEALAVFDDFISALAGLPFRTEVFVISGNHDGAERIAYGSRILGRSGLHMSPVYDGTISPFTMTDEFGEVDVYMLPFVKKATVKYFFPDAEIDSENDSVAQAVKAMGIDPQRRCVCLAHQFVAGAATAGSEETCIGGLDSVNPEAFEGFDYVALGHIHGKQSITPSIRYSGSPLKYSFSEVGHHKSVSIVELGEKGDVQVREIPLTPKNDWFDIRGTFEELTSREYRDAHPELEEGYVRVTLTDEDDIVNGYKSLQAVFHNMMELHYDNARTRALGITDESGDASKKTDEELILELFRIQNGREMSEEELQYIRKFI